MGDMMFSLILQNEMHRYLGAFPNDQGMVFKTILGTEF